ncbi:MAG TPA: uroporphyrinogen decarboxylase family protein [Armatimonadota bacterium]|nr:uroporphyrinogen decarboxylase family protein [Armatimonadota bacterium]
MPTLFGTSPDYRRLLTVLRRGVPDRVPFIELYADPGVQLVALEDHPHTDSLPQGGDTVLDAHIRAQYYLGYDYLAADVPYAFTGVPRHESVDPSGARRTFLDAGRAPIQSRADFDRYVWPAPDQVDFAALDYCAAHLPEGMRVLAVLGGGPLEWGMWMMGAERYCMTVHDDPALIRALTARISAHQAAVCAAAAGHPAVFAVATGDDWGFRTQTFLAPVAMRALIFPALKRLVEIAHAYGKPFILHSCGNLTGVMDALLAEVGIDGKHSYEDAVMPVTAITARCGDRMAVLGGIDIDVLTRADEPTLRAYVRAVLDACAPGGGYALGSGNSIANYIPARSLRVMLEEGARFNTA